MKGLFSRFGRFTPLLGTLVVLVLAYPVLDEVGGLRFFTLFFFAVLLAAVASQSQNRRQFRIAIVLAVPALVGQVVSFAAPGAATTTFAHAATLLLLAYVTVVLLGSVIRARGVSADTIAGAICVYLLFGLTFGMIYEVLEWVRPGSFNAPAAVDLANPEDHSLIYFSFVTLTTLGYGDFSPATPAGQTLAWVEAATGQLFIAILIARLVAQYQGPNRE